MVESGDLHMANTKKGEVVGRYVTFPQIHSFNPLLEKHGPTPWSNSSSVMDWAACALHKGNYFP